jgi:hypothetical protein
MVRMRIISPIPQYFQLLATWGRGLTAVACASSSSNISMAAAMAAMTLLFSIIVSL